MADGNAKKWTVMVYLAGDNNLSNDMVWALQEMREVGSTEDFKVVAQFDPRRSRPLRFDFDTDRSAKTLPEFGQEIGIDAIKTIIRDKAPQGKPWRRLRDKEDVDAAAQAIIENSASPLMIEHFINSNIGKNEPRHYLVVFSGHGNGAVGDFLQDTDPVSALSVKKLGMLLKSATETSGRKIDIVGMDCCNMSMAEVCYEIRESAEYLVGSESSVLNSGWPYRPLLSRLSNETDRTSKNFAERIVQQYIAYYSDYVVAGVSTDCAVIDLSKIDNLAAAIEEFATDLKHALKSDDGKKVIELAHLAAQSYKNEDYVDLQDFCERVVHYTALSKAAESVIQAIKPAVVKTCYSGAAFQYSHGLSVYFPWARSGFVAEYKDLSFSAASKWGDFLEEYLKATLRDAQLPKKDPAQLLHSRSVSESLMSIRNVPDDKRGGTEFRIKNYPDDFYLDRCDDKQS